MRRALLSGAATLCVLLGLCAAGCEQAPPRWAQLVSERITSQYPSYQIRPGLGDGLLVERPGAATLPVDVDDIAAFCRRGARDCEYALDQVLLGLQMPAPGDLKAP